MNNSLRQVAEALRHATEAHEHNLRVLAAREYLTRHCVPHVVTEIHDSVDISIPPDSHPVHFVVLHAILLGVP